MRTARHTTPYARPSFAYRSVVTDRPIDPADLAELEGLGWTRIDTQPAPGGIESTFRTPVSRPGGSSPWLPGRRPGRRR